MSGASDHAARPLGALLRGVVVRDAALRAAAPDERAAPPAERRRLFRAVVPDPRESLRGLVYGACAANHVPNTYGVMQHLGQTHRNRLLVPGNDEIDPADLAYALGTSTEEIERRTYAPLPGGRASFFGMSVARGMIETRIRRFSPTGLADKEIHHALWELRDLPFCPEHWDMLQDTCPCVGDDGRLQGWVRSHTGVGHCDGCGEPLRELEPIPVPVAMRADLEVLTAIADPRREAREAASGLLPEGLRVMDRGEAYDLVLRLADAVDLHRRTVPIDDPDRHLAALASACSAMRAWPDGIAGLRPHSDVPAQTWQDLVADYALLGGAQAGTGTSAAGREKPLGSRPASAIARIRDDNLVAIWNAGLVTRHVRAHGAKIVPAFDRDELAALAPAWRRRVAYDAAAFELGICLSGVEDLVAIGELDPSAVRLTSDERVVERHSLDDLAMRIEAAAVPGVGSVRLRTALLHVACRRKPWATLLEMVADRGLAISLEPHGRNLANRILVRSEDVALIARMSPPTHAVVDVPRADFMVQRDALVLMNAWGDDAALLDGVPSTGGNPKVYRTADVLARAREIATAGEICEVADILHMRVAHVLRRDHGLEPVGPRAWSRPALTARGVLPAPADRPPLDAPRSHASRPPRRRVATGEAGGSRRRAPRTNQRTSSGEAR